MKRTIKRTEITIETVEITTIRRARPDDARGEAIRNETIVMDFSLGSSTGQAELAVGPEQLRTSDATGTDPILNAKVE